MLPVLTEPQVSWQSSQCCASSSGWDELTMHSAWRSNPAREGSLSVSHSL